MKILDEIETSKKKKKKKTKQKNKKKCRYGPQNIQDRVLV